MKRLIIILIPACLVLSAAQAQTKKTVPKPVAKPAVKTSTSPGLMKNLLDSFSYAAGINIAANMKEQGITSINNSLMQRAITDFFENRPKLLTHEQISMTLQEQLAAFAGKKSEAEKAKGAAFLAQNKKKPNINTLPNGLQYEVLKAGEPTGSKPSAQDTVVVHYAGTLIDGKPFDSSIERGAPATFPVGGVIRGWTEILQLMTVGSKWKVFIPSDLAYGDRGAGGSIPPGATLVFEIDLLDIKPATNSK
ncbi:MAG: FKBP-type peptidyl-prolyl cis-trans isomerase [Ferruginibacter sp.]